MTITFSTPLFSEIFQLRFRCQNPQIARKIPETTRNPTFDRHSFWSHHKRASLFGIAGTVLQGAPLEPYRARCWARCSGERRRSKRRAKRVWIEVSGAKTKSLRILREKRS
jgi:hypothetical protein